MSRTSAQTAGPLAYAYAYAYTGNNAYAYTGANAYAYSAPMEAYGFDGMPGNPLLGAAIQSMRASLRRDLFTGPSGALGGALDIGAARWGGSLPMLDDARQIGRYGGQVRASMAMLELMSSVSFEFGASTAKLQGCRSGGAQEPLAHMTRPSRKYFEAQLAIVDSWAATRDSRMPEVLTQVAPPLAAFATVMNLQAGRHRKTLELVNVALQFGYAVCMRFKHALACPRPSEFSAGLMPLIELPPHPALPAGHANEAHITATLLRALAGIGAASQPALALRRLAHRIAENRVVAGLHFPVDNVCGRLLGDALGSYLLAACAGAANWRGGTFDGAALKPEDAASGELRDENSGEDGRHAGAGCSPLSEVPSAEAHRFPVLRQMWAQAKSEWD